MSSRSSFILRAQETLPLDSYYILNSRFSLDHSVPASHNDNSFNYPSVIATDVDKPPPSLESSSTNASLSYPPTAHLAGMPKVVISRTKTPATVIRTLPNRLQDELEDFTAQIANELCSVLPPNNTTMEPPTDEGCPYAASLPLTGRLTIRSPPTIVATFLDYVGRSPMTSTKRIESDPHHSLFLQML
ncbi:hypothetical protein BDZ97DRAFT_1928412 [Flammula alnicola]|nr:hypothetical protein BDZ97DRAFT_1928412 [Flammula alnicola]